MGTATIQAPPWRCEGVAPLGVIVTVPTIRVLPGRLDGLYVWMMVKPSRGFLSELSGANLEESGVRCLPFDLPDAVDVDERRGYESCYDVLCA